MAAHFNIGVTAWSPLGGGVLTGKYNNLKEGDPLPGRLKTTKERDRELAQLVMTIAEDIGRSPAQVALNWLRQRPQPIIPILGARTLPQLKDNLACLDFSLSEEHMARLTEASAIELGFPHRFFQGETVRQFAFGGALDKIDQPRH
jgi:aryl-alcohol dehydrogenase-like predicted oxidoreductase